MAAGRLKIDIRRKRILELLAQNGQVTVAELSGLLNATQTTIRTDLDTMAAENRLVRIPGGAIAIPAQPVQAPVQEAAPDALAAQKRAIAAKVLSRRCWPGIRRRTSCCWAARSTRSTALRSATTPCSSSGAISPRGQSCPWTA